MKTILQEEIKAYVTRRMSRDAKQRFEMKMNRDPFLADAVEGYQMFPEELVPGSILKGNIAASIVIAFVALIWLGIWGLEQNLKIEERQQLELTINKEEIFEKEKIKMRPLPIRTTQTFQLKTAVRKPISNGPLPILQKAFPKGVDAIASNSFEDLRRPANRFRAIFIHDLKVVAVDTSKNILINELPDHLPAMWESESQYLGSQKIYMPKSREKHYMETPLELFQKRQYERCLIELNRVSERLPGNLNVSFYRALSYYHLEEYESALVHFRTTQRNLNPGFYEEARWYEGRCLEKMGDLSRASRIYTEILEQNGFYAMRAASRLAILLQAE